MYLLLLFIMIIINSNMIFHHIDVSKQTSGLMVLVWISHSVVEKQATRHSSYMIMIGSIAMFPFKLIHQYIYVVNAG